VEKAVAPDQIIGSGPAPRICSKPRGGKSDSLLAEKGTVPEHVLFREDGRPIRDFRKAWRKASKEETNRENHAATNFS